MTAAAATSTLSRGEGQDRSLPTAHRSMARPVTARAGRRSKRTVVGYGFWIFLLSDIVMFSAFFATYAVLHDETAGGPSGAMIFERSNVAMETACLLLSSFSCGMASLAARARNTAMFQIAMAVTFVLRRRPSSPWS